MKKRIFLSIAVMLCAYQAIAAEVMCLKTNAGQFIEVVRVSMMVIPDGGSTFEIVVKDGEGASNVQSISFERHESDIDLSKYSGSTSGGGTAPDYSKPFFLMTNTGKYFFMKDKPELIAKDGSDKFDVKVGSTTESDVAKIYFFRGTEEDAAQTAGIDTPKTDAAEEKLTLMSPISSQMTLSGCGAAVEAELYAADGRMVGKAPVSNGVTTVHVGHLNRGVYFVKVGKKSLKFMKK
jgi:hypothetical protein